MRAMLRGALSAGAVENNAPITPFGLFAFSARKRCRPVRSVAAREHAHLLQFDNEVVDLGQELFAAGVRAMRDQL